MTYTIRLVVVFASLFLVGCVSSRLIAVESMSQPPVVKGETEFAVLAGEWEYEEGSAVVELLLDERGRGTYAYKGGRFETTSLDGNEWHGRWIQSANDREGEFVVHLTPDLAEGEGRWWYTRIGPVVNPPDKGGLFHLIRVVAEPESASTTSASLP